MVPWGIPNILACGPLSLRWDESPPFIEFIFAKSCAPLPVDEGKVSWGLKKNFMNFQQMNQKEKYLFKVPPERDRKNSKLSGVGEKIYFFSRHSIVQKIYTPWTTKTRTLNSKSRTFKIIIIVHLSCFVNFFFRLKMYKTKRKKKETFSFVHILKYLNIWTFLPVLKI